MEKQSGLPSVEELREFCRQARPENTPPIAGQSKPEQPPGQPAVAHNGHSLPGCTPGDHQCRIANQQAHNDWLAQLPDAISKKKQQQTTDSHERFIAAQQAHNDWLAGLANTMNEENRRKKETDDRQTNRGIGRVILDLLPKRSSTKRTKKLANRGRD